MGPEEERGRRGRVRGAGGRGASRLPPCLRHTGECPGSSRLTPSHLSSSPVSVPPLVRVLAAASAVRVSRCNDSPLSCSIQSVTFVRRRPDDRRPHLACPGRCGRGSRVCRGDQDVRLHLLFRPRNVPTRARARRAAPRWASASRPPGASGTVWRQSPRCSPAHRRLLLF